MITYLDSSVLLRIVLREPGPLAEWDQITVPITSVLTRVGMARTMDRNTILRTASETELAAKRDEIADMLRRINAVALDGSVLDEAARPLPVVVGTLDAIHLASAVLYRAARPGERPIYFATHDKQLATAARAMHFEVIGA
ncbi:MAG TPA: PIN domain-containing protein [Thermoanaerobaculia bacterium]|nr:PIN domain-containing protein [Thermoanaerobaculia bacterium]